MSGERSEELSRLRGRLVESERRRELLESDLEVKERELRATFDAIGDAICLLEPGGRILQANLTTHRLLGRDEGDLEGHRWAEVSPFAGEVASLLREAERSGLRARGRLEWGGRHYRVEVHPRPSGESPPEGCVLLISDSTAERRAVEKIVQSEGKLRAIFEHSGVGLWLLPVAGSLPQEGWLSEASPALKRFWGYSQEEILERTMADLCHPEDLEKDAGLLEELLRGARESYQVEKRFIHREGHEIWGDMSVSVIRDVEGHPAHLVYTVVDITARKQVELGLARINEALRRYAHSISHDLKGPLSGAIAASQILQVLLDRPITEEASADIRELASVFSGSVRRSINLINQLLVLAEVGRPVEDDASADLADTVADVLDDLAGLVSERGMQVIVEGDPGSIPVAPAHAYQLLLNLVENSLKHCDAPRPEVRIGRLPPGAEGGYRLLVRDNGPGVPEGLKERIFEEFVRGAGGGSGVGLATVRKIVEAYGGSIRAYTDGGACFEITLPRG